MKTFGKTIVPKEWNYIEEPIITLEEHSEWKCYLFGHNIKGRNTIIWTPSKGCEPNWFWRKMQWLILGNKWVKGEIK